MLKDAIEETCQRWSSISVECPHGHRDGKQAVPIACGDFSNCNYCAEKRKKRVRNRIHRGYSVGMNSFFVTLTLSGKREGTVKEILTAWDKLRRRLEREKLYVGTDSSIIRQERDPVRSALGLEKSAQGRISSRSRFKWFRVVEKAKKTPLTYGKVHMHLIIAGFDFVPVQIQNNESRQMVLKRLKGRRLKAFQEWTKILQECGFGWVINIQAVKKGHRGASSYLVKYLSKDQSSFRTAEGRRHRMYDASLNWSIDKQQYVPRYTLHGYHAGVLADVRLMHCECEARRAEPEWLYSEWLYRIAEMGLREHFYEIVSSNKPVRGRILQIAPKMVWERARRRYRENGIKSISALKWNRLRSRRDEHNQRDASISGGVNPYNGFRVEGGYSRQ